MTDNLPATQSPGQTVAGLEGFGADDMVMPKLGIDHKEGKLVDELTGVQYDQLDIIVLGMQPTRVLFHHDINLKVGPLCRSTNGEVGVPSRRDDAQFPWSTANMNPADFPEGTGVLCETCPFSKWGSHPKGDGPYCTEQFQLPIMMPVADGQWAPAIFTCQRSSMRPIRAYITGFARDQQPMYTQVTRLTLQHLKSGDNPYAVPQFTAVMATDQQLHAAFHQEFLRIQDFIMNPPTFTTSYEPSAPQAAPVPAPTSAPAAAPAPTAPQPEQVTAQSVTQPATAPAPEPTPAAQPIEATVVEQPPAQPAPASVAVDDGDIGF